MKTVKLKRTKRLLAGHLWVFSNEIASRLKDYTPGEIVHLQDMKGRSLGVGYINPHSLIAVRVLSRRKIEINRTFLTSRISQAIEYRRSLLREIHACRLIFGESDLLPGLIVDKFDNTLVVQTLTAGMERLKEQILDILQEHLCPECIVVRNDSAFRKMEGLEEEKYIARGQLRSLPKIREGDLIIEIDVIKGQKTGFFLDQRENRQAFASVVKGGKGLDLFSYSGAWALHLARKGAEVTAVDSSSHAIEMVMRNAEINGLSDRIETVCSDVFDFLDEKRDSRQRYDFIVLDPPAFVKSKESLKRAIKGYKAINASAMALLRKGGLLATSSCSYHLSPEAFLEVIQYAAKVNNRYTRIIEFRSQARDHPFLASMPETRYLKCAIVQVL